MALQYSSAGKHCCPKCGGESLLIYGGFLKPLNCEICLREKNPEAYRALKEKRQAGEDEVRREILAALRASKADADRRRGFCYWIPKRPTLTDDGPKPASLSLDQWNHYRLMRRAKV